MTLIDQLKAEIEKAADSYARKVGYGIEDLDHWDQLLAAHKAGAEFLLPVIEKLIVNLNTCKNDYWFMINLLERSFYKDLAVKDCVERMNFRKPLFNNKELLNTLKGGER